MANMSARKELFGSANQSNQPIKPSNEKTNEELAQETNDIVARSGAKLEYILNMVNEGNATLTNTQQQLNSQEAQLKRSHDKLRQTNNNVNKTLPMIREMTYSSWDPRYWVRSLR
jgi:chromosome segregation ATPase